MLVGYARVSTLDQKLDLQLDALRAAGCARLQTDVASGASTVRPGLDEAVRYPRPGDTLVVWKLDRLGRSLPHLIETIQALDERGIGFRSLHEHLDTTTPGGRLIFHLFGALAEFERDLIRERTHYWRCSTRAASSGPWRCTGRASSRRWRSPARWATVAARSTAPSEQQRRRRRSSRGVQR